MLAIMSAHITAVRFLLEFGVFTTALIFLRSNHFNKRFAVIMDLREEGIRNISVFFRVSCAYAIINISLIQQPININTPY